MAVIKTTLQSTIKAILDSNPTSTATSAKQIAQAYDTYCQTALFGGSKPTIPPTQKQAMETAILAGINAINIDAFCQSIQSSIVLYWTGIPVAGTSGTGTTIPPTGNIVSSLKLALTQPYPGSTGAAAKALADNMDLLTKTTTATLVIPPAAAVLFNLT